MTIHFSPVLLLIVASLTMAGCKSDDRKKVLAGCVEQGSSQSVCECEYDIAESALSDQQFAFFKAALSGDRKEQAKIQAGMGLVDLGLLTSRLAWLEANTQSVCR